MEESKVSIIIPVYNSEKYIGNCIKSIQKQTYSNIEIIIVDDGSTDNSSNIIKECAKNDDKIKYIYQENSGAPTARNNGIEHSEGTFIMFFDSDDVLEQNAIQVMVSTMEKEKTELVLGNYKNVDDEQNEIGKTIEHCENKEFIGEEIFKCASFTPYPGNKLYDNSVIKENNIRFANVRIGQDLNFYLKYIAYCKKIVSITDIISQYRLVNGGISRTYSLQVLDIARTMQDVKNEYSKLNLMNMYNKYISIVELVNYNAQQRKVVHYKDKIDRKIITLFMKKYVSKIKFDENTYYGKYKKVVFKFWLRVKLSFIYNSNFIAKFVYHTKLK